VDQTVITDSNGVYTFSGLVNGTYAITPSKFGYTFNSASATVTISGSDRTAETIIATEAVNGYTITGLIRVGSSSLAGVSVHIIGSGVDRTALTNSNGAYAFGGLVNGTYTITPSKSGYTFNPPSMGVTINGSDKIAETIIATEAVNGYTVTGIIQLYDRGFDGVLVHIAGNGVDRMEITDNDGRYTFEGIPNGTYTVTPSKRDYFFYLPSLEVTVNGYNVLLGYIEAMHRNIVHTVTGTILEGSSGLAGVSVRISSFPFDRTVITDSNGVYSLEGIMDGTYTITPSKSGYSFIPSSVKVTIKEADKNVDYIFASRQ